MELPLDCVVDLCCSHLLQDVNQVIADDKLMYKVRNAQGIKSWFHLGQLQWLGLPYKQRFNMTYIRKYIDYIVEK